MPTPTQSRTRLLLSMATTVTLGTGALLAALSPASAANAAEVEAVTSLSSNPPSVLTRETISVSGTFEVPEAAVAGDSMTINFSSNVEGKTANFPLKDSSGETVANCTVSAQSLSCVFTDYVDTHTDVSGDFTFTVIGVRATTGSGLVWVTGAGTRLNTSTEILNRGGGLPVALYKQALGDTSDEKRVLYYYGAAGSDLVAGGSTVTDSYDSKLTLDHDSISVMHRWREASNPGEILAEVIDPSQYTVDYDDLGRTFTVTFKPGVLVANRDNAYWVNYAMDATDEIATGDVLTNTARSQTQVATKDITYTGSSGSGAGQKGTLSWTKVDGDQNPLGGAEFTVSSTDGSTQTVADNGPLDADPADGSFELSDVSKGSYTLTESKAPEGYQRTEESFEATVAAGALDQNFGAVVNEKIEEPVVDPVPEPTPDPEIIVTDPIPEDPSLDPRPGPDVQIDPEPSTGAEETVQAPQDRDSEKDKQTEAPKRAEAKSTEDQGVLAFTGSNLPVGVTLAGAFLAFLAGTGLILLRRRRNSQSAD